MVFLTIAQSDSAGTKYSPPARPSELLIGSVTPPEPVSRARAGRPAVATFQTKLEAALDAARRGFSVFPLLPDSKIPHLKKPFEAATTNREQIAAWWAQWPDANIGIHTEPFIVVDIDPRNGGKVTAELLGLTEDFPHTLCSATAGGGSHMIYRLPAHTIVRGGAGKLGPGVDIKSWGGFIVAPDSIVAGKKYEWIISESLKTPRPIAEAPQWLIDHCKAAKPKRAGAGERLVEEDAESIERAFQYIGTRAPSAQKGNRGYTAYTVGCNLYEFGVTRQTCVELLTEWSEQRCDPPMDMADIEHAATNAELYMQNKIGVKHSKVSGFERVEIDQRTAPATPASPRALPASLGTTRYPGGGYVEALAYIMGDAPSQEEEPNPDAAAVAVAGELVKYDITETQRLQLMQDWGCSSYEETLSEPALHAAIKQARELLLPDPPLAVSAPAPNSKAALLQGGSAPPAPSRFFTPLVPYEPASVPPRPWIVPGLACRGNVTMIAGPGGVAKSTWTLQVAIAAITGREDICGFKVPNQQRVAVWNQEDDINELRRRLSAIMLAFDVRWRDLQDERGQIRLSLSSGVERPLVLAKRTLEGTIRPSPQLRELIDDVKAQNVDLLVLDPLVEIHEAGENDNVQMRAVIGYVRDIAKEADCAVLLVAHSKKPDNAKSDSFAGNMDSARGASAQVAAIRIGATIYAAAKNDDKKWAFEGSHLNYVRIDIAKNNLGPKSREPLWFKYDGVTLDGFEGGRVGILRPVTLRQKGAAPASVAAANEMLCHMAEVISDKLALNGWHTLRDVLPHMRKEFGDPLRDQKNRGRLIDKAFDGADEYLTEKGVLRRRAGAGAKGTLFFLASPQLPQIKN
jgi:hypothetical protein